MKDSDFEKIVELVVQKLVERSKKIILLYAGSPRGLTEAQKELVRLREDGYQYLIYATPAARAVLNMQQIMNELGVNQESFPEDYHEVLSWGNTIVIPTLTRNGAAKLALGISDSSFCDIVAEGIMRGYSIVAAKNGCCPDHVIDPSVHTQGVNNYSRMLITYLETLESFGVRLCEAEDLGATIKNETAIRPVRVSSASDSIQMEQANMRGPVWKCPGKILSLSDAVGIPNGSRLVIGRDTVITPLLSDYLMEHRIQIERRD